MPDLTSKGEVLEAVRKVQSNLDALKAEVEKLAARISKIEEAAAAEEEW